MYVVHKPSEISICWYFPIAIVFWVEPCFSMTAPLPLPALETEPVWFLALQVPIMERQLPSYSIILKIAPNYNKALNTSFLSHLRKCISCPHFLVIALKQETKPARQRQTFTNNEFPFRALISSSWWAPLTKSALIVAGISTAVTAKHRLFPHPLCTRQAGFFITYIASNLLQWFHKDRRI